MEKNDQSRALLEQLCTHFDLTHEPFTPLSSFFFGGGQREHVLETLRHLAIFGDQILFLTGGKGAGKTKIIDEFIRRHAEEVDVVTLVAGAGPSGETSINRFAMLSDVPKVKGEPARQTLLRLVQKFDHMHQSIGHRTVMVIDDADLLPKEELRLYVTVFRDLSPETGAVLLLAGSEDLLDAAVAGSNIPHDEWFHHVPLKPFSAEEVVAYLQGWLESSGYRGHLNLGESQAAHLVDMGRGMPGRINRLFPGLVLGAHASEPTSRVRIGLSSQGMMALVVGLFLFCFVAVAYNYELFSTPDQKPETVTGVVKDAPEPMQTDVMPSADPSAESRLLSIDAALKSLEEDDPAEALDAVAEPAQSETQPENLPAVSEAQSVETERHDAPMQELVVQRELVQPKPVQKEPVQLEPVQQQPMQKVAAPEQQEVAQPEPIPEAVVQSAQIPAESTAPEQVQKKSQEKYLEQTPETPVVQEPAASSTGHVPGGLRSAQWVRSQAPKAYSAQVLGSFSEQAVQQFIGNNKAAINELYYIKTRLKNKDWYVVLYGVYPNKSAVNAALAQSPKKIRDLNPWLRRFDGIISSLP